MAKKTEDGGVQTIDWATASPQIIDLMKDPAISLPRYGYVVDQKTNGTIRYDPYRITHNMQATIIKFFSDSPKTQHNQDVWLNVLKYRQGGASTTSVFAAFPETAWSPGSDLVVIADNKERAKYLQQRLHQLYRAQLVSVSHHLLWSRPRSPSGPTLMRHLGSLLRQ